MSEQWVDREWAQAFVELSKKAQRLAPQTVEEHEDPSDEYLALEEDLTDQFQEMNQETRNLVHKLMESL